MWEWDARTDSFAEHGFWSSFLGYKADEVVTNSTELQDYTHPDDLLGAVAAWKACVKGEVSEYEAEHRLRHKDGIYRWVVARGRVAERDARGRTQKMNEIYFDITRLKDLEESLAQSNSVLRTVLDAIPQMVFWKDLTSQYLGCNPKFAVHANLAAAHFVIGKRDLELFPDAAERIIEEDNQLIRGESERLLVEEHLIHDDGREEWLEKIKVPLLGTDGGVIGVLATTHDVTERIQAERKTERLAYFDPLTELPNRRYLIERLEEALAHARRHHSGGAVLFLDLDRFKNINDMFGHTTGDQLLIKAGGRMRNSLRNEDVAARLGGDEFVILLSDMTNTDAAHAQQARSVAEKLRLELAQPFEIDGKDVYVSATIGIAVFSGYDKSAEAVLHAADTAMSRGKEDGGNAIFFFDPELLIALDERLYLEASLRTAIANEEFEIRYQPQVDVKGTVIGAEALLRWNHPTLGRVLPARFIPVAEQCGLIPEIGLWVIEGAIRSLNDWMALDDPIVQRLAVNVSMLQFRIPGFVEHVCRLLTANPNARGRLVLELTESAAVEHFEDTIEKMEKLRTAGILFSIDDLGTGHSTLSYLARLPIDQIKIDRSFVTGIEHGRHKVAIVATLTTLGEQLNYVVVAEGVETADQFRVLVEQGCQQFQGYLFSEPLPAAAFLAYCQHGPQRFVAENEEQET
ncbi:MAG: diguanylate cyclase (GGDEF)-like protein/PAS domain S-box-containing protein [Gammaproteobacteria bacterium]|jgi:diguanylate cyclase (GGDEF)-like protein/PAS domain S-box-containing protein